MDTIIPSFYRRYGKYVNSSRAFPLNIDGLKPVERRVLLSTYDIARERLTKCFKIDGHCVGNYHPHGSAYGSIVNLVRQGFLIGQGNFGTNIGVKPEPAAAMRYTEAKLSKETFDLALKLIKYVPWVEGEVVDDKEPLFLPTKFPICLMGTDYTQGIGFGYKTFIPCYEREDVLKRMLWLIGERKTKPIIKPISDCDILSNDKELDDLLTTGKATIRIKGKYSIDGAKNCVIIHSWPPGRSFETLLKKFAKELDNGDVGLSDLSAQGETKIVFEVLKQRNRNVIFENFKDKVDKALVGAISFETILCDTNGNVSLNSIDDMLKGTYEMFLETNKKMLIEDKQSVLLNISELKALEQIRPHLSQELKNKIIDYTKIVTEISKKSKVDINLVKSLFSKYNINKLLTLNTDINSHLEKVKDYDNKLQNISKFVLDQY